MFSRVIITSGPTIEPIDPVRFISNRSSGKTGFFLAEEAKKRAVSEILFITGPSQFIPSGVKLFRVETALEMEKILNREAPQAELIIMAAAISDYRSKKYYPEKIKKGSEEFVLHMVRNPDILAGLGRKKLPGQILVGFALETENIFDNGLKKLREKNLDLLILNELREDNPAFDVDENQIFLLTASDIKKIEKKQKSELAAIIWDEIERIGFKKR